MNAIGSKVGIANLTLRMGRTELKLRVRAEHRQAVQIRCILWFYHIQPLRLYTNAKKNKKREVNIGTATYEIDSPKKQQQHLRKAMVPSVLPCVRVTFRGRPSHRSHSVT